MKRVLSNFEGGEGGSSKSFLGKSCWYIQYVIWKCKIIIRLFFDFMMRMMMVIGAVKMVMRMMVVTITIIIKMKSRMTSWKYRQQWPLEIYVWYRRRTHIDRHFFMMSMTDHNDDDEECGDGLGVIGQAKASLRDPLRLLYRHPLHHSRHQHVLIVSFLMSQKYCMYKQFEKEKTQNLKYLCLTWLEILWNWS